MDRRSFIGNVLGIIVSSQLPFKSEEALYKDNFTCMDRIKAFIKLLDSDVRAIRQDYRMFIITNQNVRLWAPRIVDVQTEKIHTCRVVLQADEIKFTEAFTIEGVGIIDKRGNLIKQASMVNISVRNGDSLRVTYTLSADL